jgi:fluoroquinolone resistance protein
MKNGKTRTALCEDKEFTKADFSRKTVVAEEYESCRFIDSVFSNTDLSNRRFADCVFENCDFSLAKISKTVFQNAEFRNCKLVGLHFENVNPFLLSLHFDRCQLDLASFFKLPLKKTRFTGCRLQEVDFSFCDLTGSVFDNCDLSRAVFDNTNLEKTDFRTSYNFSIHPEKNKIKKAKFSAAGIGGLLTAYDIIIE